MNDIQIPGWAWLFVVGALAYLAKRMIDRIDMRLEKIEKHVSDIVSGMRDKIDELDRRHGDKGMRLAERVTAIEARCEERHLEYPQKKGCDHE